MDEIHLKQKYLGVLCSRCNGIEKECRLISNLKDIVKFLFFKIQKKN